MNLIEALGKALRIPELRRKLLMTVGLLLAFRCLASVPIPGANKAALDQLFSQNGLLGILDVFSGGGLRGFTIVGLGLNPYINATIIFQLMTVVSTRLKEISKEGEAGRRRITRYQRWLTVPLAAVQSFAIVGYFKAQTVQVGGQTMNILPANGGAGNDVTIILTLTCGTVLAMWLGELISEYGIGNGVSLIIFAGIIGRLPAGLIDQVGLGRALPLVALGIIAVAVTAFIIWVQQAERRVPTQSAQRILNPRSGMGQQGGRRNNLPLRVNAAGVIPIIFAVSLMQFPGILGKLFAGNSGWMGSAAAWVNLNWQPNSGAVWVSFLYNAIYFLLVLGFTFFYTYVQFDPDDVADNLKKSAVFIPGVRPGRSTAIYLRQVLSRITWGGAIFLAVITVVMPLGTAALLKINDPTFYLGGTAILIVVGVALDTMKQIEAQLIMRQYRGFIR